MPSNPFYSGRIPPELLDAIEKHRELTGESKTDLLIKALSQYVGFQLQEEEIELPPIYEKLDEIFSRLEKLENSVFSNDNNEITEEETKLEIDPNQIEIDFNTEEKTTNNSGITNCIEDEEKRLSSKELAELLGVSKPTISKWKKKNLFPKSYKNYEITPDKERSKSRANLWIAKRIHNEY